jgi:hypothetical protein
VARIIAYIICGGFSVMMLFVGTTQFLRQRRLLDHAEQVDAEIVKSEVFVSTSADTDPSLTRNTSTTSYRPDVTFRYRVGGVQYESELLHPNIIVTSYASRESAAEALAPFPVNAKVRAWVDPSAPDKAFLIAEAGNGPLVFVVVGLVLIPVAWLVGKTV